MASWKWPWSPVLQSAQMYSCSQNHIIFTKKKYTKPRVNLLYITSWYRHQHIHCFCTLHIDSILSQLTATGWKLLGWHPRLSSTCSPWSPISAYAQNCNMQRKLTLYTSIKLLSRLSGYIEYLHCGRGFLVLFLSSSTYMRLTLPLVRVWG